ncbi:hypothetical protein Y032_0470g2038 [Ancylostoma ceylanicum]|uniref:Uncharacterized protein n=1 Tax=Ancylostoma ceylanicum TaxID=53326 RepID=A0A016WWI7_9BILA|nr:hypothetical protein Y032_0470g2038 [Ancylostoma ceylanicum]
MVFRAENMEESAPLPRNVHLQATSSRLVVVKSATRASVAIEQTLIVHSRSRSVLLGKRFTPDNDMLDRASSSLV